MAEVATQQKVTQLGPETVPGTGVAATKGLVLSEVSLQPDPNVEEFGGVGRRFMVASAITRNRSVGKIGGPSNYTDFVYWGSAAWGPAVITTPAGGTLARKWAWDISLTAALGQKTFTLEDGTAVRAQKGTYLIVPDFGEKWGRDRCDQNGSFITQGMQDGITLTGGATLLPRMPHVGSHNNYYYDASSGGIGGTKLTRVWDASWDWKGGLVEKYPQDRANTSYATHVDIDPVPELTMLVAADAAGMAMYADCLADTTKYLRFEAIGPMIETGSPNQFYAKTIDAAVRLTKPPTELKDEKGIRAIGFSFRPIEDTVWGFSMRISAVNTLTAL